MKKLKSLLLILFISFSVHAEPVKERTLLLEDVHLEDISIKGRLQNWTIQKFCIDGQAYLIILGISGINSIAPSFKEGKPEQCRPIDNHDISR